MQSLDLRESVYALSDALDLVGQLEQAVAVLLEFLSFFHHHHLALPRYL